MSTHRVNPYIVSIAVLALPAHLFGSPDCQIAPTKSSGDGFTFTVTLTDEQVNTLGLRTVDAERRSIQETQHALGKLRSLPERQAVVSTRIPGRVVKLFVALGDQVQNGTVVAEIESRMPGDPPPIVQITAPADGMVGQFDVRVGEPVEPDAHLIEINDFSVLYAVAQVFESQAGALELGMKAYVSVPACPEHVYEGTLVRFGTEAAPDSRTIEAWFRIENHHDHLRPGLQARFGIITGDKNDVFAIPRDAAFRESGVDYMYIGEPGDEPIFTKVPVRLGMDNGRMIEVINGLLPGDRVVVKGQDILPYLSASRAVAAVPGHDHGGGTSHADDALSTPSQGDPEHGNHHRHPAASARASFPTWVTIAMGGFNAGLLLILGLMMTKLKALQTDEDLSLEQELDGSQPRGAIT